MNIKNVKGFSLPAVIIVGLLLMMVTVSSGQGSASISDSLSDRYYNRIAQTAAEAGVSYASYCLSKNNYQQTWGSVNSKPNLAPGTDCNGDPISGARQYVLSNSQYRSSFSVGNLNSKSNNVMVVEATGTTSLTIKNTGTVVRTFDSSRKQVVQFQNLQASISSSGSFKTCAILSGQAYCWGYNGNASQPETAGNLGDGTTDDSLTPVKVLQEEGVLKGKTVTAISAAQFHVCAIADGEVYCWGYNSAGQLGNGTTTFSTKPVKVGGLLSGKTVTAIGTSGDSSCAITGSKIYCWGRGTNGVVGDGSSTNRLTPVLVSTVNLSGTYNATALSSGSRSNNMCAVIDAWVYCWGENNAGQIGNGVANSTIVNVPTRVSNGAMGGATVTSISHDGFPGTTPQLTHVCAVASGKVYCWGENGTGQLGRAANNVTRSSVPVAVDTSGALNAKTVTGVSAGINHTCAVASGKAYCWGSRAGSQVGDGVTSGTPIYVPKAVLEESGVLQGKTISDIGGGSNRGCAITSDAISYCWGTNGQGQLGDGTTISRNKPTESVFLRPKLPAFTF